MSGGACPIWPGLQATIDFRPGPRPGRDHQRADQLPHQWTIFLTFSPRGMSNKGVAHIHLRALMWAPRFGACGERMSATFHLPAQSRYALRVHDTCSRGTGKERLHESEVFFHECDDPSLRCAAARHRQRRGMTLVEMLVAMALSLIIILAVTQVFRLVGDNVLASRAVTEMAGQLRSTSDQLRRDLGGLTVPVLPWTDATTGLGYFEISKDRFGIWASVPWRPPHRPPARDPQTRVPFPGSPRQAWGTLTMC